MAAAVALVHRAPEAANDQDLEDLEAHQFEVGSLLCAVLCRETVDR